MSLHGVSKNDINKIRRDFDKPNKSMNLDIPSLEAFNKMGLSVGKPNTTRVIRPEHKKRK